MEEYAIAKLPPGTALRGLLLRDALASYGRAAELLHETTAWRERWPYLARKGAGDTRTVKQR